MFAPRENAFEILFDVLFEAVVHWPVLGVLVDAIGSVFVCDGHALCDCVVVLGHPKVSRIDACGTVRLGSDVINGSTLL